MKRLLFLLPIGVFVVVLVAFMAGLRRDPSILPSMLIGKPLPAFALAPVRPGEAGLSSQALAGQPALLNVFASTCGPCMIEHPLLLRLKAEGVMVAGIDWKEPAEQGAAWLAQNGDPYVLAGNDPEGRAGIDLGVSGTPETFVLDRHGRVRYRVVGAITPDVWNDTVQPLLTKLRSES
ncbi:MAG: DsbE family thiol:disulfide interchange protein [Proteobacteria bacterium]|nr:DsbE family thiol:disulfide interchange protein [Pseudomonadota bacterium]